MLQNHMQVVEQNNKRDPRQWSRSVRWRQPSVDWIDKPPDAPTAMEKGQIRSLIRCHSGAAL